MRETLIEGDPRFLTALAPVLVSNIDRISLSKLYLDLTKVGLERRLGWICENTLAALSLALRGDVPRSWAQRARRAEAVLGAFLDATPATGPVNGKPPIVDALDRSIRSKKTLDQVKASSSDISRKWDIVSSLTAADFAESLRAARVAGGRTSCKSRSRLDADRLLEDPSAHHGLDGADAAGELRARHEGQRCARNRRPRRGHTRAARGDRRAGDETACQAQALRRHRLGQPAIPGAVAPVAGCSRSERRT